MSDPPPRPIVDMFRYETTKRQVVGLQKDHTTTLRLRGARPVTILELPTVDGYHPNSAVLLPESPAGNERSGLAAVGVVLQYARAHPTERLLVADHEPGDEALSRERAEVALALLLGLHEELALRCQARHDPRDAERLLAFVARNEGWDCDPAQRGREGALIAFRRRFEAERGAPDDVPLGDGPVDHGDWIAFARCQDAALARFLSVDEAGLAALRARVLLARGNAGPPGPGPSPPPPPPLPPIREPDPVVEPGSAHAVVADLQAILNARGYPTPTTGVHDADSVDATRWFQADFTLTGDGVVDEATWRALRDPDHPTQPLPPAGLLKTGATGSRVRRLQAALNDAQGAGLTADGKFGAKTNAAVQTLQSREGLGVDGIAGPKTWTALIAKIAPPGPVPPHLLTQPPTPIAAPAPEVAMTQPATPLLAAVGCGQSWPPDRTRLRDYEPTTAARLDFLLFLEEDLPVLDCHTDEACDWKSCDLYRKAKYRGLVLEPPAPPKPAQGKPVLVLALAERSAFQVAEGKAPAGPLFQPGAVGDSVCLEGLAKLLKRGAEAGADRSAVAVHGRAPDVLAARRAENAAALLRGKAGWAAHSKKHATVADWQRLLKWVDATRQWDCDPGAVDDLAFGKTKTALDRFRGRFHEQHGVWLDTSPQLPTTKDWEAFYTLLVETLGQHLGGDAVTALAALQPVGAGHVVCGAKWTAGAVEVNDYLGQEDDRIELLLFKAADAPADLEPTGDPVYRGRVFRAEHVDLGEAHRLLAQVVDEQDQPVNDVAFEVHQGDRKIRSGRTAADGLIEATVLQGTYRVKVLGAPPEGKEKKPEPWEGGDDTLEELLAGDYQHRGSYFPDMTGFRSPHLQAWLVDACARAGCDPLEVTKIDESKGAQGDSEQGLSAGVPRWLTAFQTAAMTSTQWGTQEQIYSRLMGAFYYSYFIERFYAPAGVAMPANVEYFILHLGMTTGNGAATFDNIGAMKEPYCASASSRAYLKGLSLYGFGTKATGYAPGGPGAGHGLPVGFHSGRKPGAQFRPKPGDVMSVHTAIGPPDGHVLTVIWAETDGSKDGWMWQVSGNASHRSVCCSFSKLADDPNENTKPGFISTINVSYDHELQPHTLAVMSDAELTAKKCFRLTGTSFPPPNAPGVIGHPSSAKPREALLVAGDVPTSPISQPGAPTLLKISLQVLSFTGACAESAPDPRVLVAPGAPLRLQWEVQGYERLVLQPGDRDVTLRTMEGEPFVELSPLEHPPTDGRYTLEAYRGSSKRGSSKVTAQVEVRGIVDFRVFGRDPDARSKNVKKAELLQRTMKGGHPKYGTPFYSKVDSVGALPGAFQELDYDSQDGQSWFWGQITPRSDARLVWKAIWPVGRPVLLTLNRKGKVANAAEDVSGACREENGLLVGEHDYLTHGAYQTFFEADLQLTDEGGAPETSAMIRLRENYEMPGLKSFELSIDGRVVRDGDELDVAGKQVTVSWELTGSHSRNGLELLLLDVQDGAGVVDSEVVRARPQDGEPTPAGHKENTGSKRLALKLPKGRLEVRAVLEMQNVKGRVAHKQVTFTIAGGGGSDNGADVNHLPERVEVHLFDDELRLVPGPYKLTMGSFVEEKTSSNGVVVFEVKKVPQAQRLTSFELEWGEKDALGFRYSKTMFLGFQQGTQEEQAKRRLHNLGYPISRAFEQNLRWFQDRTPGLERSGRPDAATLAKLTGSQDGARIDMHDAPAPPTPRHPTV